MKSLYGEEPDCENCLPSLLEKNVDTIKIYLIVQSQLIIFNGHVVDINQLAIWEAIDRYEIKNAINVFEKVLAVFRHFKEIDEIKYKVGVK